MDLGGYMRVSRKGDRDPDQWLTVPAQRAAITGWIERNGHHLADMREDIDVSGGLDDRPNLEALVAQIERGELGGLVVAKVDRFSRDLAYGAVVARRVELAGGTFVAADDGIELGPTGRDFGGNDAAHFQFAQMLAMADFFRRRIGTGWRQVIDRHVLERGRHWGYAPPFGYDRGPDGRLIPSEKWAAVVAEVFDRRAGGEGCSSIARWLEGLGARTARGGVPTHDFVAKVLRNRVYLGEARAGERVHAGAHAPLVDEGLFAAAALAPGGGRRGDVGDQPVLSGLVRCWACRTVMTGTLDRQGRRLYRCRGRSARGECPAPARVLENGVLPAVERVVWDALGGDADATAVQDEGAESGRLEREVAAARRSLEALLSADLRDVDPRVLERAARGHQARLDEASAALDAWRRRKVRDPGDVRALRDEWDDLPAGVRNAVLRDVVGCVVVRAHRLGGGAAVLLVEDVPGDLPRPGVPGRGGVRAFPPLDDERVPWVPVG